MNINKGAGLMRNLVLPVAPIAGLLLFIGVAQAQSTGTVTATCKDGTSFTGAKRAGACRGHGGVQSWGAGPESSGLANPAIEPASTPASAKNATQAQGAGTVTATCKDGTSFSGAKRSGACRGHGGVQSWGAAEATTIPVNAPAELATPAPATSRRATPVPASNGQVWVNTDSRVYHCPGTRWYGKTKEGTYMSEVQAQAQGAKPDHGKACTS
jgi:hypothetical protein